MKKLFSFALVIIGLYACLNLSSCKKDDEPSNSSIYGIWTGVEDDPDNMPMLITNECWIMNDGSMGANGTAAAFIPYVNANYDTLEKKFAPNDEFCIYRYDSKNGLYICYMGDGKDKNGNIVFSPDVPILVKTSFNNEFLICEYMWVDGDYEMVASYNQIMSDSKYADATDFLKYIDDTEVRTYTRYK